MPSLRKMKQWCDKCDQEICGACYRKNEEDYYCSKCSSGNGYTIKCCYCESYIKEEKTRIYKNKIYCKYCLTTVIGCNIMDFMDDMRELMLNNTSLQEELSQEKDYKSQVNLFLDHFSATLSTNQVIFRKITEND